MGSDRTIEQIPYEDVNADVVRTMTETGRLYYIFLFLSMAGVVVLWGLPWAYQIYTGQGVTGLQTPAFWGIYLANFIFWIGISHSGTLLSAILFITQTPWRRSIYRSAEAMTFFSVMTASIFVFVHMGRPWNFYWTVPYPNQRGLWLNFMSPLMFDVFAISTYATSSMIFLYFGSIPDLAAVRDRVKGWRKEVYTVLSLGWRGTDAEWHWLTKAYTFFAVFIIPLAVSVHSIVSWDFALSKVPGLSKTIFAPYFVVGAIYSGSAGIVTLMIFLRRGLKIEKYITKTHFDKLGMLLVVMSLIWSYINVVEVFTGWYADTSFETESLRYRMFTPPFSYMYWLMIFTNTVMPLFLIFRKVRRSMAPALIISLGINVGMWIERYLIIATSLPRKFHPYMWNDYIPSLVEISITLGSFCFFTMMFLMFVKLWPSVSIYEVKEDIGIPFRTKKGHH
ncbi:MAG TPA: NrfD/PsrC family molybdoenzyme membrane anchor subunit [Thermodesulfobacteriota bacterium]|nr:NrfD/PsrC family molybdoenzyme membrane anchor subunit [Thermodesulfobacteriota bacterium]